MIKYLYFLLIITLSTSKCFAELSNSNFVHLSSKDGLSQNSIYSIYMDRKNYIWIGSGMGLNRFNGSQFEIISPSGGNELENFKYSFISKIAEDNDGNIWILSSRKLYRYNYETNEAQCYINNNSSLLISSNGEIYTGTPDGLYKYIKSEDTFVKIETGNNWHSLTSEQKGVLYLIDNKWLYIYHTITKKIERYRFPIENVSINIHSNFHSSSYFDPNNTLWIITQADGCYVLKEGDKQITKWDDPKLQELLSGYCSSIAGDGTSIFFSTGYYGLIAYDPIHKKILNIKNKPNSNINISQNNLSVLSVDRFGDLWIGTKTSGINYLSNYHSDFKFFNHAKGLESGMGNIGSFADFDQAIYVGSEGSLLRIIKKSFEVDVAPIQNAPLNTFEKTGVKFIKKQDSERLWLAPYMRGLHLYNIKSGRIEKSFTQNIVGEIKDLFTDKNGKTWIAGVLGLGYINPQDKEIRKVTAIDNYLKTQSLRFSSMVQHSNGNLYISSMGHGIIIYNPTNDTVIQLTPQNSSWMPDLNISAILFDIEKKLWIGTFRKGVFCFDTVTDKVIHSFNQDNGLPSNSIRALTEANDGSIWVTTPNSITQIDANRKLKIYNNKNGFPIEETNFNSLYFTSNGKLWIGGNNGFTLFSPSILIKNIVAPKINLTSLTIQNSPQEEEKINKQIRNITQKEFTITIKYNSFPLLINFNALNYIYPAMNQYVYQLKGVSDDWNNIGNNRSITIPTLQSGKYAFHIKVANNDGVWDEEGIKLYIKVLPPFWFSWWAYIIYLIILAELIFAYLRYYKTKTTLVHEAQIQLINHQNTERAYNERLELYTNFSHELRTPLTLIIGPVKDLIENQENKQHQFLLTHILKNANRMLFLVNQLMDYRRLEKGKLQVNKQNLDLVLLCKNAHTSFSQLAKNKQIDFILDPHASPIVFAFDESLMESLLSNLISNAFKYTPNKGKIAIRTEKSLLNNLEYSWQNELSNFPLREEYIQIVISDTGTGIAAEHLEHIFTPFFKIQTAESKKIQQGTGIGLSFCNQIVNLHEGIIIVKSKQEEGSTFRVILPYEQLNVEFQLLDEQQTDEDVKINESLTKLGTPIKFDQDEGFTILVVEDNPEINEYICSHLRGKYTVLSAENGQQALQIIQKEEITLIISDIMMPIMDGNEFCVHLKSELSTSHIPIILLTARTAEEHIIEGYQNLADDYITKPFSMNILFARIDNLIRRYLSQRIILASSTSLPIENSGWQTLDLKFMKKVYEYIDQNIADSNLNLEDLCDLMYISKVHLNRKIKALTALTPGKFIVAQRFKRAILLMKEGETSITEIAYSCGFSDPTYFSRCFKSEYNISPSEYLKKFHVEK